MKTSTAELTLAELEADAIAADAASKAARELHAEMLHKLGDGDASVTAAALTKAEAEVTRTAALQRAADARLRTAQDAAPLAPVSVTIDQTAARKHADAAALLSKLGDRIKAELSKAEQAARTEAAAREAARELESERAARLSALPNNDHRLGEYVAQAILRHGLSPYAIIVTPGELATPQRSALPLLVITSGKASEVGYGLLSGAVELLAITRTEADPVPDLRAIKRALSEAGWRLGTNGATTTATTWTTNHEADRITHHANLAILEGWSTVPNIDAQPGRYSNATPHTLAQSWRVRSMIEAAIQGAGPEWARIPTGSVQVDLDIVPLSSIEDAGVTTTKLGIRAAVLAPNGDQWEPVVRRTIEKAWPQLVGALDSEHGVITAAEPVRSASWSRSLPTAEQANGVVNLGKGSTAGGAGDLSSGQGVNLGLSTRGVKVDGAGIYLAELTAVRATGASEE